MLRLHAALRTAREALAAEAGCCAEDFSGPDVCVFERPPEKPRPPLARRYPPHEPAFAAISLGTGAVISASRTIFPQIHELFRGASRDDVFDPLRLAEVNALLERNGVRVYGPIPRLTCGTDTLELLAAPDGVEIALETYPSQERLPALEPERWPNAISPRRDSERPTTSVAIATAEGRIIGVAAMGADSERLWQIGIDVEEKLQRRGVGAALTATLAHHALEAGFVPFYGLAAANVPSLRTALAAGFVPAWVEVFVAEPR